MPVSLVLKITEEERTNVLASILAPPVTPRLEIKANEFRGGPDALSKEKFRAHLVENLLKGWKKTSTAARFFRLVELLQQDGCAVFAGLIDMDAFHKLVDKFSETMRRSGSHAFLHSFANIIEHPDILKSPEYNNAIVHPLLIALLSYVMGGPIRMTDARGKDTQPISVNAQDNMLHVDNTPFRQEYKILLAWEKGTAKGPTGQNFTFLPGTQKGNRLVRVNERSQPWSTENDSLFITDESLDSVFNFQSDITGHAPRVVEVEYPEQPITVVFNAGALVHHRYRNNSGRTRSCVITAFHLSSDHPGALIRTNDHPPQTVAEGILGYQNGTDIETFCSLISAQAPAIEDKITDILDQSHHSTLVDTAQLRLSGEKLQRWRETTLHAPSATRLKFEAGKYLSFNGASIGRDLLLDKLAGSMAYDKHGLLDLIIYADGHEEVRKPARKSIWTMSEEKIRDLLASWLQAVEAYKFTTADVQRPATLQEKAHELSLLLQENLPDVASSTAIDRETSEVDRRLISAHQLIVDLGESITRCEKVETYITTNLFLFLITDQVLPALSGAARQRAAELGIDFLRAYIACVLMVEHDHCA
jgi:hypothetical protein